MSNLLFVNGGTRWKFDEEGCAYTDSNFNNLIWERYSILCDSLTVLMRREKNIYKKENAKSCFNEFKVENSSIISVNDLYKPKINLLKLNLRNQTKTIIEDAVKKSDLVIIRSLGNYVTDYAYRFGMKYEKKMLVEVTGFEFEGWWYHGLLGKLIAVPKELLFRRKIHMSPYVLYVTNTSLQKRYPTKGIQIGCTDVVITNCDGVEQKRREKIKTIKSTSQIVLGTAAHLNVDFKGQKYVIAALGTLKKRGISNIVYELIGSGDGKKLLNYAKKHNVGNQVVIRGEMKHDEVDKWLDTIDIYIHPSLCEGLCRSIIEAMSRGCPVLCSDVGGNRELIHTEYRFKKGNSNDIAEHIKRTMNPDVLLEMSEDNYCRSKIFSNEKTDKARMEFYEAFSRREK